jgi:hypothetical protein
MADLALLQSVSYIAGALGVCVAAFYYVTNLRLTQRNQELSLKSQQQTLETRQIQIFTQFYDRFFTNMEAFFELLNQWSWKDLDDFWQKYGPESNPIEWSKLRRVFSPWEQMGVLVHEGVVDPKYIYYWAGPQPADLWEKFYPVVLGFREKYEKEPKGMQWEFFEDLAYVLRDLHDRDVVDLSLRLARRKKWRESLIKNSGFILNL